MSAGVPSERSSTLVSEHLDTFLATFREAHDKALPRYVEKELRAFLDCGDLRCGFALAKCRNCGRRIAVSLSCKRRGVCGSCIARRMADAAAHMVDHVFPVVPVRQWVLSTPFEIRLLLARDAAAYGAVTRFFAEEIMRFQARHAVALGIAERASSLRSAGISAQQRWGSTINLNPHIHAAWCDGVFIRRSATERAAEQTDDQPLDPTDDQAADPAADPTDDQAADPAAD